MSGRRPRPSSRSGHRSLTDPLPVQYNKQLGGLLTGHPGKSFTTGESITVIMGRALPITGELALLAVLLAMVVGIPLGVMSAVRPNSSSDTAVRICGLVGLSIPNFWFATLALLVSSLVFHWVPPVTWIPPTRDLAGNLSQVAIPVVAISVYLLAVIMRMTRATMLEVLGQDYVRTARAKGVASRGVVFRHALRNSLIPVVTVIGFQIGGLMGGATVVEVIFGLPGMGYQLVSSISARDYPVIEVCAIFLAAVFVLVNLLVDLLYGLLDPRIETA